jgi:hypothetical protein
MAIQGLFTHEAPLDIVSYLLVDQISRIPHANSTLNGKGSMLLCPHNPGPGAAQNGEESSNNADFCAARPRFT